MHSRRVQQITRKLREFQDNPAARDQNYDETLKETEMKRALARILKDINRRMSISFHRPRILPNYAFQKRGCLKSIILKRREKDGAYNWKLIPTRPRGSRQH